MNFDNTEVTKAERGEVMWYYQISAEDGKCLEGGVFKNKDEMRRYCERRMKQLNAYSWWAEYRNE